MITKATLASPIFNDAERRQAFAAFSQRQAKEFKNLTRRRMIEGARTGRTYRRKRGDGFTRSHRASARGERPAPDTMTLVNAITDERTGEFSARVFIGPEPNPNGGTAADRYGEILQTKLERPIMTESDAREAERKMARDGEALVAKLV